MRNQVAIANNGSAESDGRAWLSLGNYFNHLGSVRLLKTLPLKMMLAPVAAVLIASAIFGITAISGAGHIPSTPKAPAAAVKKENTPSAASCNSSQQNAETDLFARCPGFAINFAATPNGPLTDQFFNIYTGAPPANQEAEFYTADTQNLRVAGGYLNLEALQKSTQGYEYTSARVDTKGKEDFLYGKLVVRATLPDGVGTWPAIWMLPSNPKYASLSPPTDSYRYLNDGEIDIAESIGAEPHVVYGIAHSLAYPTDGGNRNYYNTIALPDNDTAFHDYELDWTPTTLAFLVDGQPFFSMTKQAGADYRSWPYDQPFYLVLNLAIGGSWGGIDGIDNHALPATMKVQSINYYPYLGPK